MLATLVETKEMTETVVASIVAGIGITVIFSIAIWGAARFIDLSRSERPVAAGAAAVVTALALAGTIGSVALGIIVMTSK